MSQPLFEKLYHHHQSTDLAHTSNKTIKERSVKEKSHDHFFSLRHGKIRCPARGWNTEDASCARPVWYLFSPREHADFIARGVFDDKKDKIVEVLLLRGKTFATCLVEPTNRDCIGSKYHLSPWCFILFSTLIMFCNDDMDILYNRIHKYAYTYIFISMSYESFWNWKSARWKAVLFLT